MKTGLQLLLFTICSTDLLASPNRHPFRCDYTYFEEANGWVKFHEIPANWNDARLICTLEGGSLASPVNAKLLSTMKSIMKDNKITCGAFTGVHATLAKGMYASIEGVLLSQMPYTWATGEPDNYNDEESCLALLPDGTMADVRCNDTFPYMCYKKSTSVFVNGCGTTDPEYSYRKETGSCYKFHNIARNFFRAQMTCMAEGGHLAIINSLDEAKVLSELYEKNPETSRVGAEAKNVVIIGFYDWNEHGDWRTVQGQTLTEAGYDKFANGEPNFLTTKEYCGSIYKGGLLNDVVCGKPYTFICEKALNSLTCI